jgi:ATP-dependent DNA helicase RecG
MIEMKLKDIKKLAQQGESQQLEFKKTTGQLKGAFETACAFLNGDGGVILIGVTDDGKIVGQEVVDKTKRSIANELDQIEPFPTSINIQYLEIPNSKKNTSVIVISTTKGQEAPYTCDGRSFLRNQTSTVLMPREKYFQLMQEISSQSQNPWDMQIVEGATIEDLDHDEIKQTIEVAVGTERLYTEALSEPIDSFLIKLGLMKENQITNAAMILFSKHTINQHPESSIRMARFSGNTNTEGFIDNQRAQGNVFQLMKAANAFIMHHLPVTSSFDESTSERIDKPVLPVLARREALSNALCHKDYSIKNTDITLAIYDSRMEIWNNGLLNSNLTFDDLKVQHSSYLRNKKIAEVFYLRGLVERWGTGTTKMIERCRENGIPDPIFQQYSSGFSVIFPFKEPIGLLKMLSDKLRLSLLSDRQKELLSIIKKHDAISVSNILKELNEPPSDRMVRKDLGILRENGLIQLVGHGKSAKWLIKPNT